jgi:hypothetical protein
MNKHFPVSSFDAIYLVDLCEPLLEVARKRFARRGWKNVTVLCQDANEFSLPEWSRTDPKGSVSFVTLSYSLSMVSIHALLATTPLTRLTDSELLYVTRPHRLRPFPRDWLTICRRFLHFRATTVPPRESHWRHQQGMWLAQPMVLADMV